MPPKRDAVLVGVRSGSPFRSCAVAGESVSRQAAGEEKRDFSRTVLKRSCPVRRVLSKERKRASARRS